MQDNAHPLVTIAIPTYKRADDYLKQAIRCAVNQTYPNIEVIVSDNCSPDNTKEVVQSLDHPRLTYFRQPENLGANNNFNFCVKQARGDYFLLLQDDDLIDLDFVEVCMQAARHETGIGIIRSGTRVINADGNVLKESPNRAGGLPLVDFFRAWFTGKTSLYLCSTLFNTQRLQELGGFRSKHNLFQDVVAEVKLAAKYGRVDVYEPKASFRKHSGEMTFAVKLANWCEDSRYLLDIMCDLVPEDEAHSIRQEGMRFFSRLNYNRAQRPKSLSKRLSLYWTVYKHFNYQYSPFYFFVYLKYRRQFLRTARKVKHALMSSV
jgi:glycosyltransferase involved in cell wall biosynthesis